MPTYIIYSDLSLAQAMQSTIDAALGYPKDGTDYNGGIHDQTEITNHYVGIRQHPTLSLWAIFVDDTVRAHMTNGEQEQTLASDWIPARPQ